MAYVYNTSIASADTEEAFRASVAEVSDEGDSELTVKTQKKIIPRINGGLCRAIKF